MVARLLAVLAATIVVTGCGDGPASNPPDELPAPIRGPGLHSQEEGADSWTLVALPDTQYLSRDRRDVFEDQTRWIAARRDALDVRFVVHEGDIVQDNTYREWQTAAYAVAHLDAAEVPYALAVGNHDLGETGHAESRSTWFTSPEFFGPGSSYATQRTVGGFFEGRGSRTESSWHTFTTPHGPWLVLSLEFAPRDAVVDWANAVVEAHPDHRVILVTHAYLYVDDSRYDFDLHGTRQAWSPMAYRVSQSDEGAADGQDLWERLVSRHAGFRFVLSGHILADGTAHLASVGAHGNVVHQLAANYQTEVSGTAAGLGYLRLLRFLGDDDTVDVTTFSPYLWKRGSGGVASAPDQSFTLSMTSPGRR